YYQRTGTSSLMAEIFHADYSICRTHPPIENESLEIWVLFFYSLRYDVETFVPSVCNWNQSVNKTSSAVIQRIGPFQGPKEVFNVGGLNSLKEWQPIINYTSHDYEIKAMLPRQDKLGHTFYTIIVDSKK
ncbi:MAG: hypothetical protein M3P08_07025, partial [Thermoproteota archaeon]|nr:hypothetical protein [Thermoproteota archaeon]